MQFYDDGDVLNDDGVLEFEIINELTTQDKFIKKQSIKFKKNRLTPKFKYNHLEFTLEKDII